MTKGETDEEVLLQAESEHDDTAEQVEETPANTKVRSKITFFEEH
jgi:hypothetical protein